MTREEAIKLCEKFEVNYLEHPQIIVTSVGNVYTTGIVDPSDKGERIELNTEDAEAIQLDETGEPVKPSKGKKK